MFRRNLDCAAARHLLHKTSRYALGKERPIIMLCCAQPSVAQGTIYEMQSPECPTDPKQYPIPEGPNTKRGPIMKVSVY